MLHGIVLQASVTCQQCRQPVHLQGLSAHTSCAACQAPISLPASQWKKWFGGQQIAEAMLMPSGKAREISELGARNTTYAYGNRMPRCQSCKTDLPAERLPEPGGLPPKALLLLGKQSDPARAAAIRARPDYQAARATQRTRLLLLGGGLLLLLLCAAGAIAVALFLTQLT